MEGQEPLQPYELAEQMRNAGYEVKGDKVKSERLGSLIDRSEQVWRELQEGQFEENEFGYVTFGIEDWVGDYRTDSGDHVDALIVYFNAPDGARFPLGSVSRLSPGDKKATASVNGPEGAPPKPVLPPDDRWDAVVGVTERAITRCLRNKREREGL